MRSKSSLLRINYLGIFMLIVPVGIVLQDNFATSPLIKGQSLAIAGSWVIALVAGILWVRQNSEKRRNTLGMYVIVGLGTVWFLITTLDRIDGQGFNYNSYLFPILLIMIFIKPLTVSQIKSAASLLAVTTLVLVLLNEVVAVTTDRRELVLDPGLRMTGLGGYEMGGVRWIGPFDNPNYAGPVLAFLIIYSLSLHTRAKWVLILPSLVLLSATGSRSAFLGLLLAASCYFIFSSNRKLNHIQRGARIFTVGGIFLIFTLVVLYRDPTLSYRTPIWSLYVDYWLAEPISGVGTQRITNMIESGEIPYWNSHAHNLVLDLMGRYGSIAAIVVLIVLALAVAVGYRAARNGMTVGFALVVAFIGMGITEVHGSWGYLGEPLAWLILGTLLSEAFLSSKTRQGSAQLDL